MTIAIIVGVCVILAILAFLLPRLSTHAQRGVDSTLGAGESVAGSAPGKLGDWLRKPFQSSTQGGEQERPEGPRGTGEDAGLIALLANPDSGRARPTKSRRPCGVSGATSAVFGLDEIDAAVAAGPDRLAVAGGDGSLACVAAPAGRAGDPACGGADRHRQRLRTSAGHPAGDRRGGPPGGPG